MCGRFAVVSKPERLAKQFDVEDVTEGAAAATARYNIAPTTQILVIADRNGQRTLGTMKWGLVPFYSKDPNGSKRINARAEKVAEGKGYRQMLARKRCIIPADGFYEWQAIAGEKHKQPWYFTAKSDETLAFAGLWDVWRDPSQPEGADKLVTCTIITVDANADIADVHDRMPLALSRDQWNAWLDVKNAEVEEVTPIILHPKLEHLQRVPVSIAVNRVGNDSPELIEPIELSNQ